MNVDDELLSDLLTDRAAPVMADPALVQTVRDRARRRRRVRGSLTATAVAAAAAVAVTVAFVAPSGHGGGPATLLSGAGQQAPAQALPAFPLTPTHLPAGLGPAYTVMIAGQTALRYDPSGTTDDQVALDIQVSAALPSELASQSSTPAAVNGTPAQVIPLDAVSTRVLFTRAPGQVVTVTGTGPYASAATLLTVAASLTDQPIAATPPFVISDLPDVVGPVNAYDRTLMSFGPDGQQPTLTITYAPGSQSDLPGPTPTFPPSVSATVTVSPSVASVDDSRPGGLLRLVSSVLSTAQLQQLASHVVLAGSNPTAASTSAGPGAETSSSSVPGTGPGVGIITAPTELVTTLPSAGPQPPDAATALAAVRAAFHTAFTAEPAGQPYFSLGAVEGGGDLHGALDQLRTNFPQAVATVTVTTGSVVFTSPTSAAVQFTLTYTGGAAYGTQIGHAVRNSDGSWLVTRDTYCAVLAFGGASCPGS